MDFFYKKFEERYRGSREVITERLRVYLPFVEPMARLEERVPVLDLGCGRGEWLELMRDVGLPASGVEIDPAMVQACQNMGLSVRLGDAVTFLGDREDESLSVVSAFHIIEHLDFEKLRDLVFHAHRVLKPGGLLIMETPNPENIRVATNTFYFDPSHQRPLPWQLMSFVTEFYGFVRTKILYLQEYETLVDELSPSLVDVLTGVSPDYAIVAQKQASQEFLSQFEEAFCRQYGLTLETLCRRFEKRLQEMEAKAVQVEAKAVQAENALKLICSSRSWRLTAPLRWVSEKFRDFRLKKLKKIGNQIQTGFRWILAEILRKLLGLAYHYRRMPVKIAKKLGLYGVLHSRYMHVAERIDELAPFYAHDEMDFNVHSNYHNTGRTSALSLDEIISRIRQEIEMEDNK